jgi:molybdopterin-guanine dinucleotide biosynthesis protein A
MSVDEQLAGDSDKHDFGRLAGVLEALQEAKKGFVGACDAQARTCKACFVGVHCRHG